MSGSDRAARRGSRFPMTATAPHRAATGTASSMATSPVHAGRHREQFISTILDSPGGTFSTARRSSETSPIRATSSAPATSLHHRTSTPRSADAPTRWADASSPRSAITRRPRARGRTTCCTPGTRADLRRSSSGGSPTTSRWPASCRDKVGCCPASASDQDVRAGKAGTADATEYLRESLAPSSPATRRGGSTGATSSARHLSDALGTPTRRRCFTRT